MTTLLPVTVTQVVSGAVFSAFVGAVCAWVAGRAWRRFVPRREPLLEAALAVVGLVGTSSVVSVALMISWGAPLGALTDAPTFGHPLFAASLLGTVGGHVAVLAWARALETPLPLVRPGPRWLLVGVGAGAAALLFSATWTRTAELFGRPMADQGLVEALLGAPPGVGRIAALAFVVAAAPLLEELVFRGYLQTALAGRFGAPFAIGASAALFGLFHLSDPAVVPVLAVVGGLLGWVRHASGSVWPAIVAHLVNNVAAMAIAFGS